MKSEHSVILVSEEGTSAGEWQARRGKDRALGILRILSFLQESLILTSVDNPCRAEGRNTDFIRRASNVIPQKSCPSQISEGWLVISDSYHSC